MNYYGEHTCQGRKGSGEVCSNKAYYQFAGQLYCGVHCKDANRIELPKNPHKEQDRQLVLETHRKDVFGRMKGNTVGKIILRKMKMMKEVELIPGYLNVFPNFKHQNRKDGYGCAALSPMSLGPIEHRQPGLPNSLNLENYYQGNKYFEKETIEQYIQKRQEMYLDPVPHRHKYPPRDPGRAVKDVKALFSIHVDLTGMARGYSYLESRYFYCHFYEKLAKNTEAFLDLKYYHYNGIDLCIVGYDAYPVSDNLYNCYLDTSKPFGHELVLYCLLMIGDPAHYPWNIFYTQHKEIYPW